MISKNIDGIEVTPTARVMEIFEYLMTYVPYAKLEKSPGLGMLMRPGHETDLACWLRQNIRSGLMDFVEEFIQLLFQIQISGDSVPWEKLDRIYVKAALLRDPRETEFGIATRILLDRVIAENRSEIQAVMSNNQEQAYSSEILDKRREAVRLFRSIISHITRPEALFSIGSSLSTPTGRAIRPEFYSQFGPKYSLRSFLEKESPEECGECIDQFFALAGEIGSEALPWKEMTESVLDELVGQVRKIKTGLEMTYTLDDYEEVDHQERALKMIAEEHGQEVAKHLILFRGPKLMEIVRKLIEDNYGDEVAIQLSDFEGKELTEIGMLLITNGYGDHVERTVKFWQMKGPEVDNLLSEVSDGGHFKIRTMSSYQEPHDVALK